MGLKEQALLKQLKQLSVLAKLSLLDGLKKMGAVRPVVQSYEAVNSSK